MNGFKRWLRRRLLRWLFPASRINASGSIGSLGALAYHLQGTAEQFTPACVAVQVRTRRMPDVEPGTIRIVIEECEG